MKVFEGECADLSRFLLLHQSLGYRLGLLDQHFLMQGCAKNTRAGERMGWRHVKVKQVIPHNMEVVGVEKRIRVEHQ